MLDPTYVRDHIEAVRTGLRNRGLDPDKALEEFATLEIGAGAASSRSSKG